MDIKYGYIWIYNIKWKGGWTGEGVCRRCVYFYETEVELFLFDK